MRRPIEGGVERSVERRPGPRTDDLSTELEGFKRRKYVPPRRRALTVAAGAVFGLIVALPLIPVIDQLKNGRPDQGDIAPSAQNTEPIPAGATSPTANPSADLTVTPPPTGPYVLATFHNGELHLSGTVPDVQTSAAVLHAAETTYPPNLRPELAVDGQVGPADWLAGAPQVITVLALATSGSVLIADGEVALAIQAPTAQVAERIETDIANAAGLPVVTEHVEITNLQPPLLEIRGTVHQLALSGRVPTEQIRDDTLAAAVDVYGPGNVTSQLVVDDTVHIALWMYHPQGLFESLFVFPEVEIQLNAETTTGFVRGGYHFEPDSAQAEPTSPDVIAFAVDLMNRDPSLLLLVEAHTDADGADETNQALSQQRAETVAGYYIDAGIDPDRITAIGKGETDPLTQDTTPEGKARNRRIEVKLSTLSG